MKEEKKSFLKLETKDKDLFLEGIYLKGVEDYEIKKSSALPTGKAELEIRLIVEFPDNMPEQNLSQAEKE